MREGEEREEVPKPTMVDVAAAIFDCVVIQTKGLLWTLLDL